MDLRRKGDWFNGKNVSIVIVVVLKDNLDEAMVA
jgi:hypothetical protein